MRWLRYEADGREAYGIIEGDEVVEVKGDPFAGYQKTATRRKVNAVKFLSLFCGSWVIIAQPSKAATGAS